MDEKIAHLNDISTRLNRASDLLAASIEKIERKFASLRLGVSAFVEDPLEITTFMDANCNEKELRHLLAYRKAGGAWRLVITKVPDPDADLDYEHSSIDIADVPLQQAPRELRVKALQKIPTLLSQLEKKAEEELNEVERALSIVNKVSEDNE